MFAYELKVPSELALVHMVFHVSLLNKYIGDPESILPIEDLGVKDNLSYDRHKTFSDYTLFATGSL